MTESNLTRRQVLVATGTVAVAGLVAKAGATVGVGSPAGAGNSAAAGDLEVATNPLTFVDGLLSTEEMSVAKQTLGSLKRSFEPNVLQLDLVREWRDGLHGRIVTGAELVAVTRWDKALLLRELARESAFEVQQERIAPSLFRTRISPRVPG
jgi:hypothetical protein